MKFQPRQEHLTDDELLRVVGLCAQLGFRKLRLTGGEPTVRPHLVELVRAMKSFPGIDELSMTTNALLLGRIAGDLKAAGLDRVNISIDTLDPDKFKLITRGGRLDLVWRGIEAADAVGLTPIKLNAVVVRDQNDHEVGDLAALTLDRAWQVRFLEIMPLEGVGDVHDEGLVTSEETQARLEARFGPLEPVPTDPADPARLWRIPGAAGTIGFISPVSAPFCAACNRVRLTAETASSASACSAPTRSICATRCGPAPTTRPCCASSRPASGANPGATGWPRASARPSAACPRSVGRRAFEPD
jgi:cyclic pyranopterin phosphate synthase